MIDELLAAGAVRTNYEGYCKLVDFYDRCRKHSDKQIHAVFEQLTWFDSNLSALILAILKKLEVENNLKFFVDSELIEEKFNILIQNGLVAGVEFVPTVNKSIVKLSGFKVNEDTNFIRYIENELLSHPSLLLSNDEKAGLISSFLELFCNVQKHARTNEPIFACGHYYENVKRLCFTLVDIGVGYLPPISEFTKGAIKDAGDAISWAIQGNSTKKDAPGGLGLTEIQRFCSNKGAAFQIITGDAYWSNYQLFPTMSKQFSGTTVNVIFDCNQ
jgi:hypothetical protein